MDVVQVQHVGRREPFGEGTAGRRRVQREVISRPPLDALRVEERPSAETGAP
jgi:hypothetical protein